MWCGACQQDVPGVVASSSDPSFCCPRCGKPLCRAASWRGQTPPPPPEMGKLSEVLAAEVDRGTYEDLPEFVELEDWEFEETIQEAERLVRSVTRSPELGLAQLKHQRTDRSHRQRTPASMCRPPDETTPVTSASTPTAPTQTNTSLPWVVLAIGLGVFVCGAALMGLSLVNQRPQLWQLGLPMVLGGQMAVLAVVIWQLDVAWNSHRATFVALHALDDQLRRLREDWNHQREPERTDEQPFYRHLAAGAAPDVLLADLKRQIDVLSTHLARDKRAA